MGSINGKSKTDFLGYFLIVLLMMGVVACGGSSGGGGGGNDDDAASTAIGKDGGTVEDATGAQVEIPAGALSENQNISIVAYLTTSDLPQGVAPMLEMRGAVKLEPSGLTFAKAVTVTVPVSDYMEPRTQFPLLYWNTSDKIWEQTEFIATVADNGMSFSADVTHFSIFGGGAIEDLIYGGTIEQFKNDFTAWFEKEFMQDKNPVAKENECYQICGAEFDLSYQINDEKDGDYWLTGDITDSDYEESKYMNKPLIMVDYIYDITKGQGLDGYVRITSTMHYKCAQPDFVLMADKSVLSEGESTTVRADLACGGIALTGKEIIFDKKSGPGEISPGRNTTNSSGTATATFTAGDANAVIRAYYVGCEAGTGYTMERETPIAVTAGQYNLSIAFEQTMQVDDFFDFVAYGGDVPIRVTSTDSTSGIANVEGSATFEVNGYGTSGECSSITSGMVTFTYTGTLVTDSQGKQTLNLTQTPNFSTIKTTYCPDEPPLINDYLTGGEVSQFSIPAEDGYAFGQPVSGGPIESSMSYVLYVLK